MTPQETSKETTLTYDLMLAIRRFMSGAVFASTRTVIASLTNVNVLANH